MADVDYYERADTSGLFEYHVRSVAIRASNADPAHARVGFPCARSHAGLPKATRLRVQNVALPGYPRRDCPPAWAPAGGATLIVCVAV